MNAANFYSLKPDCYLVDGAARAALYDLELGLLYSISKTVSNLIKDVAKDGNALRKVNDEEKTIFNTLKDKELLVKTEQKSAVKNIKELAIKKQINFAWMEITRTCNLSCSFCYESSNPFCTEKMSFEDFKIAFDNLKSLGVKRMQFIGGEPMVMRQTLKDMITYCRAHLEFLEVYTNGTLINEEWCDFFIENKVHVATSVHSYIACEHDFLTRVRGSHKKVEKAIKLMQQKQVPHRIATIKTKSCSIGKKCGQCYTLHPSLPKLTGEADLNSIDFEIFKGKAITKETKRYPLNKNFVVNAVSGHNCFAREVYISTKLDVYPCVMERRFSYGNLKEKNLGEIIDHKVRFLSKDNIKGCSSCEYRYQCFDCRPDSNGNKDMYAKPWVL